MTLTALFPFLPGLRLPRFRTAPTRPGPTPEERAALRADLNEIIHRNPDAFCSDYDVQAFMLGRGRGF